jgi:hypothetical protein
VTDTLGVANKDLVLITSLRSVSLDSRTHDRASLYEDLYKKPFLK